MRIIDIYYDGQKPRSEGDEYAAIQNVGRTLVNLSGWRLNADDDRQDFWFPAFELQPSQRCRPYTNENHPEYCGFSIGRGDAIWANGCKHGKGSQVTMYFTLPDWQERELMLAAWMLNSGRCE